MMVVYMTPPGPIVLSLHLGHVQEEGTGVRNHAQPIGSVFFPQTIH